jgi:branched-chain amino acid transport system permease protein
MSAYVLSVMTSAAIWAILAMSLNVVTGYAGQVSLGQAAFFAIGAYAAAMVGDRLDWTMLPALGVAVVVTGVAGALIGVLALRVRDDFLVFVTIGINFIVVAILQYTDAFGGAEGIVALPVPSLLGEQLDPEGLAMFAIALALAIAALLLWLERSWTGYGFAAVREDEAAARACGVPVALMKLVAFGISGLVAGAAGGLYAYFLGNVFPQHFGFLVSITVMAMLVLGGLGTVQGAIVGAAVLTALPELLRVVADYRYTIFGIVLVLTVSFVGGGLVGRGGLAARALGAVPRRGGQPA